MSPYGRKKVRKTKERKKCNTKNQHTTVNIQQIVKTWSKENERRERERAKKNL